MNSALQIVTEKVNSSQIDEVGYKDGVLLVKFKNGGKYLYFNVNEYTYASMITAPSVGSFFSNHIKNDPTIKCVKLG